MKTFIVKNLLLTIVFVACSISLFGQNQELKVEGVVYDDLGGTLIGALIQVKERPDVGGGTDLDGRFSVKVFEG